MVARRQLPGGRHGLSPNEVAEHQRRRIMDAVVQVTADGGAGALTVQRVLAHAGISRKTFYDHFPNREAAVQATYRLVTQQLIEAISTAPADQDQPLRERQPAAATRASGDGLARGLETLLGLVAARPDVARFCLVEAPRSSADVAAIREAFVLALVAWLRSVGGRGEVRLRAGVGGLLEVLGTTGPGDHAELLSFLRDVVSGG